MRKTPDVSGLFSSERSGSISIPMESGS